MNGLTIALIALGGALLIEGVLWAVIPAQMLRLYRDAMAMGEKALHQSGLVSTALGVILITVAVKFTYNG